MVDSVPGLRIRPHRTRVVGWVVAGGLVAGSAAVAATASGPVNPGQHPVAAGDRVALMGLGILAALAVVVAVTRPLVEADDDGVRVRNLFGTHELHWSRVRAVRFDRRWSWACLELDRDELVPLVAVQAVDADWAVVAVRSLRERHAASGHAGPRRPGRGAGMSSADHDG